MKKLSSISAVLCAAALLSAPVVSADDATVAEACPTLSGKVFEVDMTVGQTASITLKSNSTTGYSWQLAEPLTENSPVEVKIEIAPAKDKDTGAPLCGAPDETLVTFTAKQEGAATITLQYVRPWEKDKEPADARIVVITVSK